MCICFVCLEAMGTTAATKRTTVYDQEMQNSMSEFTTHPILKTATATHNSVEFLLWNQIQGSRGTVQTDFFQQSIWQLKNSNATVLMPWYCTGHSEVTSGSEIMHLWEKPKKNTSKKTKQKPEMLTWDVHDQL